MKKFPRNAAIFAALMAFAAPSNAFYTALAAWFAAASAATIIAAAILVYAVAQLLVPDIPDAQDIKNEGVSTRVPSDPKNKLPVVYGEKRVAGQVTFADISEDNQALYLIISLSEGPVEAINEVRWQDKKLSFGNALSSTLQNVTNATDGDDNNEDFLNEGRLKIAVYPNGGRCTQMETNSAKWAADKTERAMPGVAYVYVELTFDAKKRVTSLPTNVTFNVKGKKVKTVLSDGSLSNSSTYSNNPADCLVDFLLSSRYGCNLAAKDLDLDSFYSHKTFCDEMKSYIDNNGSSASAKRYTVNGVASTKSNLDSTVSNLTIGNSASFNYSLGKFGVVTEKVKSSTSSFSEDNIYGGIDINLAGFDSKLNKLTVKFNSIMDEEQENQVLLEESAANKNPNEPVLEKTITLPFTNNNIEAERAGAILLNQSRQDIIATFTTDLGALATQSGDIISISHKIPDWSSKKFRVLSVEEADNGGTIGIKLVCQEYADLVYADRSINEYDVAPNTNFPSPFALPVLSNLVVAEDMGVDTANLVVTWDDSNSVLSNNYTVKYRFNGQPLATPAEFSTTGRSFEINGLEASSIYYIEVSGRTVNGVEIASINATGTTGTTRVVGAAGADSIEVDIVTNNGSLFKGSVTSSQATADVSIGGELQSDSDHNTFKYKWEHLGKTICVDTNRNIIDDGSGNPLVSATGLTCGTGVPADSNLSTDALGSSLRTVVVGTEDAMNVTYIQCFVSNIPD